MTRALRSDAVSERCYSILIGTNLAQSLSVLLRGDEVAPAGDYRWRIIAQTDDFDLAIRILDRVWRDLENSGRRSAGPVFDCSIAPDRANAKIDTQRRRTPSAPMAPFKRSSSTPSSVSYSMRCCVLKSKGIVDSVANRPFRPRKSSACHGRGLFRARRGRSAASRRGRLSRIRRRRGLRRSAGPRPRESPLGPAGSPGHRLPSKTWQMTKSYRAAKSSPKGMTTKHRRGRLRATHPPCRWQAHWIPCRSRKLLGLPTFRPGIRRCATIGSSQPDRLPRTPWPHRGSREPAGPASRAHGPTRAPGRSRRRHRRR